MLSIYNASFDCLYCPSGPQFLGTSGAGKGLISSMSNSVCIWVSRLEQCFHTRRLQRDCLLYVFSIVSLEVSRQGVKYVTTGAGKGLKGSLVIFFLCTLIYIWMTRWGNVLSHRDQSNGLSPVWILWQVFRWMNRKKILSHQMDTAENKVLSVLLVIWWASGRRKE